MRIRLVPPWESAGAAPSVAGAAAVLVTAASAGVTAFEVGLAGALGSAPLAKGARAMAEMRTKESMVFMIEFAGVRIVACGDLNCSPAVLVFCVVVQGRFRYRCLLPWGLGRTGYWSR